MRRDLPSPGGPELRWSITPEGNWRHVSGGVAELLGYQPKDLAGTLLFDYVHPADLEGMLAAQREWLEGGQPSVRHRLRHRDGRYVEVETRASALHDEVRDRIAEIACVSRAIGVELLSPLAHEQRSERIDRISRVLHEEAITPFYQPIVELHSSRVIGYEALSRFPGDPAWTPDRWFDDAWELGMGVQLELLAARVIARSLSEIPGDLGISINASPPTLAASEFMACLGTQAGRVTAELTEHLEIEDYTDLRRALAPLLQAGGKTAIDDFGAGYASLAHIVKLHPDWIKLDISLTDGISENPVAHALARALVSFAETMRIGVIAEGIETDDELEALREIGVQFGQGFHLGIPAPLQEALAAT